MVHALQLLAIFGLCYLAALIAFHKNPTLRERVANRFNKKSLASRFESARMNEVFKESGVKLSSKSVNIARYGTAAAFIFLDGIYRFLTNQSFSLLAIFIMLLGIFFTEPLPFTPANVLMKQLRRRMLTRTDSELIGFMKLYENSRLRANPVQFYVFCRRVSSHFIYIQEQLLELSERVIDRDIQNALDWWVKQYPLKHPFIGQVRSIILTTESMSGNEATIYLKSQGQYLTKLSSDQYEKRGMIIGDLARILNAIPSILTFVMIVAFIFMYLAIIRQQTILN